MSAPLSAVRRRKAESGPLFTPDSLCIKPYTSSPFDTAVRITPTVILPRSRIPIQWLAGAPSRVFALPDGVEPLSSAGHVAVVKIEGERQLSAVERLTGGIHVLYRLSTQIRLGEVRKLGMQLRKESHNPSFVPDILGDAPWWASTGVQKYPHSEYPFPSSPAALCNDVPDLNTPDLSRCTTPFTREASRAAPEKVLAPSPDTQQSMDDVCDHLRHQYYETLYLSKTSLAYFSKSALSRARAASRQKPNASAKLSPMEQLTGFLQQMIIPLDKMDIKFRKTLTHVATEEVVDNAANLRPDEESYVHKWRLGVFGDRFIREGDERLKTVLQELKIRETELQVILLLEILALNKDQPPKLPEKKGKKKQSKRKTKGANLPDPDTLLELLVDRLSIWHSIGSDMKEDTQPKESEQVAEKDHLRHFCVEVIMAFYASKLPEKCASINKKFGGHMASSKRRDPLKRSRSTTTMKQTPKLTRTSTAPTLGAGIDTVKRDSLSALAAENAASKSTRGGTLNSKSFSKRVIQLDAKPEPKKIDEELKNAIQALTKPNRAALASELVDSAEQRLARAGRKQKKPTRVTSSSVLVTATPRKRKIFSMLDNEPNQQHSDVGERSHNTVHDPDTPILKRPARGNTFGHLGDENRLQNPVFSTPPRRRPVQPSFGFDSPAGGVPLQRTPVRSRPPPPSFVQSTPLGKSGDFVASTPLPNSGPPSTPKAKTPLHVVDSTPLGPAGVYLAQTPLRKSSGLMIEATPPRRSGGSVIEETPPRKSMPMFVGATPMGDSVAATPMKSPPVRPPPPVMNIAGAKKAEKKQNDIYAELGWGFGDDL